MAGNIRVVLNRRALGQLLNTPKLQAEITRRAEAIAAACNTQSSWGGYESAAESHNRKRASANVWTIDTRAARDEARYNRLLRNVNAGSR